MERNANILWIMSIGFIFLVVVGCNLAATTDVRSRTVLVLVKTLDNPYFQEMVRGFQSGKQSSSEIEKLIIRAGNSEGDSSGQRQILEAFYNELVRGREKAPALGALILTPASSGDALVQQIKKYRDAGIPVVIVDTRIATDSLRRVGTDITCYVASSNEEGGRMAGDFLRSKMANGGRLLLINGLDGIETAATRRKGFLESIKAAPGQFTVTERTCDWENGLARTTVDAILRAGDKVDGIFAANDQMALGAVEAIRQRGISNDKIPIVGFDAIEAAKKAVDEGTMAATIMQQPEKMGQCAIDIVAAVFRGDKVPAEKIIPVRLYKK